MSGQERVSEFAPRPRVTPPEIETQSIAPNPLAELLKIVEKFPSDAVPKAGVLASQAMENCFETTARDMEKLGQDHVDRALALQQQIQSFCTIVRESGRALCATIERESARDYQVSMVMRHAREVIALPPTPAAETGE